MCITLHNSILVLAIIMPMLVWCSNGSNVMADVELESRLFPTTREERDTFWEFGVGAMRWMTLYRGEDECRALQVLVPGGEIDEGRDRGRALILYMERERDSWLRPGGMSSWDGDEDAPTLTGGIGIDGRVVDGLWIRGGKMIERRLVGP